MPECRVFLPKTLAPNQNVSKRDACLVDETQKTLSLERVGFSLAGHSVMRKSETRAADA